MNAKGIQPTKRAQGVWRQLAVCLLLLCSLFGNGLGRTPVMAQSAATCESKFGGSMVGYWRYDNSADPMLPTHGSLRGSTVGAVPLSTGKIGQALTFNGGAYVDYGTGLNIPAWDQYTVAIWFLNDGRLPPQIGYGQKIIDKTTMFSDFFLGVQNSPNPVRPPQLVFMYDRDFKNIQTSGYNYVDGLWHHAVILRNGLHGELWVDGVLIGTKEDVNPTINNQPLWMGYSSSPDGYQRQYWGGLLDEFAVFNRALTAAQIIDLHQRSTAGNSYCDTTVGPIITVNSAADPGNGVCDAVECTLREAIALANVTPDQQTIAFNIPGAGPHTIRWRSPQTVSDSLTIDGYTQPGAHPATSDDPAQMDAHPLIVLDGSQLTWESPITPPHGFYFCLDSSECVMQGLVFHSFRSSTVQPGANAWLIGNFFGTDATGTVALPNGTAISSAFNIERGAGHFVGNLFVGSGILVRGGAIEMRNNRFGLGLDGAPLPAASALIYPPLGGRATVVGNLIAHQQARAVYIPSGYIANNVLIDNAGAALSCGINRFDVCVVEDNTVVRSGGVGVTVYLSNGTGVRRNQIIDNGSHGIVVNAVDTLSTQFNPAMVIEENLITRNGGAGIVQYGYYWPETEAYDDIFMTVRNNRIYENGGLGIDLSSGPYSDGVTPNDPGDGDTFPNGLQNFPLLGYTGGNPVDTVIQGVLNTKANGSYRLDFYASGACDPAGYGEGERYLGNTTVTTDGDGNAAFTTRLAAATAMNDALTATATDSDGATSEFSQCVTNAGLANSALTQVQMTVDRSRLSEGLFVIRATFRNRSTTTLTNGFFRVTRLAYGVGEVEPAGLVVRNAVGGPRGTGALVAIPSPIEPDATFAVTFEINLPRIEPFAFFVDAYGQSGAGSAATVALPAAESFAYHLTDADLQPAVEQPYQIYLPVIQE